MSKYYVGDKVRVKSLEKLKNEFEVNERASCIHTKITFIVKTMGIFCDHIVTISHVDDDGDYYIEEDNEDFWWSDDMFEGLVGSEDTSTNSSKMEMNIGKLKEFIKNLPDDMPVFVSCEGYCNYDFDYNRPFEDTDTFGIVHDGKLFITDDCSVDIGNGETF